MRPKGRVAAGLSLCSSAAQPGRARMWARISLRGVIDKVDCPILVIHGAKDRLFPPEQAERIAREAKHATLLMYPEGNHVCNNITYKYRPAMADWMRERLAS